MSAFSLALATILSDANFGVDVELRRPPFGWKRLRVVLSTPTEDVGGFGSPGARAGTLEAVVAAADYAPLSPMRGDELRIAGAIRHVEAAALDVLGIGWRLTLSDIVAPAEPDPVVGAIRYDAWDVPGNGLTIAEQAALSQAAYVGRAPFWAQVADSNVTLPAITQARMDTEIGYAAAAGLGFWAFLGWDPAFAANAALNLYRSSGRRSEIGFCMIENMQGIYYLGSWLPNVARTIGLMAEPGYQKVFGTRPLLFINSMSDADIVARFGSPDAIATILAGIRTQCKAAGVGDPYIVMMDSWAERAVDLASYGADAVSAYAVQSIVPQITPFADLAAKAKQWRTDAAGLGFNVVPPLMSGWDYRPRIGGPQQWFGDEAAGNPNQQWAQATPTEIATHVADSVAWMRANGADCPAQTAILYAWNEFTEGGWVCPTATAGGIDASRIAALSSVLKAAS